MERDNATDVGSHVVDSAKLQATFAALEQGASPSYPDVVPASSASDRPLETRAADLLLTFQMEQRFDNSRDEDVRYFLKGQSEPMGAALAASITLAELRR